MGTSWGDKIQSLENHFSLEKEITRDRKFTDDVPKKLNLGQQKEDVSLFGTIREEIAAVKKFEVSIDDVLIKAFFKLRKNNSRLEGFKIEDVRSSILARDTGDLNRKVESELIGILVDYYNQRHTILKELMKVELVKGSEEIALFNSLMDIELTSEDSNGEDKLSFSIQRVNERIEALLTIEKMGNVVGNMIEEKSKNRKDIENLLKKLITMLEDKRDTKVNFIKLQNLMRNLNYHRVFIPLFVLAGKVGYNALNSMLIRFFILYTDHNPTNQETL